jgi:hypothetical protein
MGIAGTAMLAMAVVLVIQLGDGSSLLSVGLYGAAFVLSRPPTSGSPSLALGSPYRARWE